MTPECVETVSDNSDIVITASGAHFPTQNIDLRQKAFGAPVAFCIAEADSSALPSHQ